MPEALPLAEPVRIQAAAADLHHRTFLALRRQGVGADLPGDRCRVVKDVVEAAGHDVEAGVGGTGIGGAERVELLDRAIGVDHDQRARHQPEPLYLARTAEDELDKLAEQPDPRLFLCRTVPAFENLDQPVRISRAGRGATVVGVRQQQVNRGRGELQQRLVGAHRVVLDVHRAQDAAVTLTELWRLQPVEAAGDRVEAVAAVTVGPVPPGRLSVAVQADANPDPEVLEHVEQCRAEQRAIGLHDHVHLGRHGGTEQADQAGQPFRSRQQRLAAVQDDVDALEPVRGRVVGDALDGLGGHGGAHPLGQLPPGLVRHLVDVTVRTRQIAAAVDLQDELPEGHGLVACGPDLCHVQVE